MIPSFDFLGASLDLRSFVHCMIPSFDLLGASLDLRSFIVVHDLTVLNCGVERKRRRMMLQTLYKLHRITLNYLVERERMQNFDNFINHLILARTQE